MNGHAPSFQADRTPGFTGRAVFGARFAEAGVIRTRAKTTTKTA